MTNGLLRRVVTGQAKVQPPWVSIRVKHQWPSPGAATGCKGCFLRKVYASCPSAQPPASRRTTGSIPVPMVVTSHDKQNTVNASQLLKLGAFKLQPLVDFIEYTELIKLRLEVRGRLQGPGRFGLGLHLQPGCKPITQAWHHCLVGLC